MHIMNDIQKKTYIDKDETDSMGKNKQMKKNKDTNGVNPQGPRGSHHCILTCAGLRVVDAAVAEVGAGRVAEARETVAVAHSRSVDAARVVLALTAQLLGPAAAASALRRPPRPPRPTGLVVDVLLALRHRQAVRHGRRPTDSSDDGRHHQTPHLNRHLFLVYTCTYRQTANNI